MSSLVYRVHHLLSCVLSGVRIGTNLDLFLLLWTLLSGRFLASRGAVFPALADFGLSDDAVRRSEAALSYGEWAIADLIESFDAVVRAEGRFEAHVYGGWKPVAGDLTAFYRPCLKDCPTKHYCAEAGRALPAIRMGILARIGSVGAQRWALPVALVRSDPEDASETAHRRRVLKSANVHLADDEVLTLDRGFPLAEVIGEGIERFAVRLPQNFTARRAMPPPYPGYGRPCKKGEVVRPLARCYNRRTIPATPPDRTETWIETVGKVSYELRADFWDDLILKDAPETEASEREVSPVRFGVVAIVDPRFDDPLLLGVRLPPVQEETVQEETGADARGIYLDRWAVEGLPLVAKVILGTGRQFVFGTESRQRLPELALLAGSILAYLSASEPAHASGFWDRNPQPTAGRLRRVLSSVHYDNLGAIPSPIRKKDSPTAHLLKGVQAHRRRRPSLNLPLGLPLAA
jgi:hypothetical protein